MFLEKTEGRPQSAPVHELDDRKELFELVFERRARQYEGITTLQLFDGAGGGCRPIANALGFIEDNQVRTHVVHIFDVLQDELVTGETEEGRVGVELLAMRQQPVNDLCGKITELLNLRLPLVFDGSGSNHQNPLNAPTSPQQLSTSDGLDCLAKTHIVSEDHPTATGGEKHSANLIGKEGHLQKAFERALAFL